MFFEREKKERKKKALLRMIRHTSVHMFGTFAFYNGRRKSYVTMKQKSRNLKAS